jgi:L-serine deaminase
MEALYRVSDGWIFNAPCDESILTAHELGLISSGVWGCVEVPDHIQAEHIKHYEIIDGEFVLLPEEKWPDYMPPEEGAE